MKTISIPKASEEEKKEIGELVEKCLTAKGVGVEAWETEIDERVVCLYGLTPPKSTSSKENELSFSFTVFPI